MRKREMGKNKIRTRNEGAGEGPSAGAGSSITLLLPHLPLHFFLRLLGPSVVLQP